MPRISDDDLKRLAAIIERKIMEEFGDRHLSGNLMSTLEVTYGAGTVAISIPAEVYNFYEFFKTGAIVPRGKGSYASSLDIRGSEYVVYDDKGKRTFKRPRNHVGYVNRIINDSIAEWTASMSDRYEQISKTDTGE